MVKHDDIFNIPFTEKEKEESKNRISHRIEVLKSQEYANRVAHSKLKRSMYNLSQFGEDITDMKVLNEYKAPSDSDDEQKAFYMTSKEIAKAYTKDIGEGLNPGNMLMVGKQGTGKSYLARSMMAELISKYDKLVLYLNMQVVRDLSFSWNDEQKMRKLEKIKLYARNTDLLILDDVGVDISEEVLEKSSKPIDRFLYDVSNTRMNKPIVITTNLSKKKIKDTYDIRIYSRLFPKLPKNVLRFKDDLKDLRGWMTDGESDFN